MTHAPPHRHPRGALRAPRHTAAHLLGRQFRSPIILLLAFSSVLSLLLGEFTDSAIVLVIIVASGVLGFVQERGAVHAVDALLDSVQTHCDVLRDGVPLRLTVEEVAEGDVVVLKTGDVVPADCTVQESRGMSVNESILTGEHHAVDKRSAGDDAGRLFMGTHVESGSGTAVVTATGPATRFGELVGHVSRRHVPTSFERGVTSYGRLLARTISVLVGAVLVLNVLAHRPLVESVLFSLALAVGLTPQMLPAIITFSLSRGAAAMAAGGVVVKRLDSIEDIGAMDILCTDKTGTVTSGIVTAEAAVDVDGHDSVEVARLAVVNAALHTGYPNPLDDEIVASLGGDTALPRLVAEVPFDFERRLQSVVVEDAGSFVLVTKGSFDELWARCRAARAGTGLLPRVEAEPGVMEAVREHSSDGARLIAVGTRVLARDETPLEDDLVLEG
ncbi:MAG: HAD-IC family P-type ATPase, partial [Ilumatobacteraceae bacterium]